MIKLSQLPQNNVLPLQDNIGAFIKKNGEHQQKQQRFSQGKQKFFRTSLSLTEQKQSFKIIGSVDDQISNNFTIENQFQSKHRLNTEQYAAKFINQKLKNLSNLGQNLPLTLQVLDLSSNKFPTIPKEVFTLQILTNLNLDNNLISQVTHQELLSLKQLKVLSICNNQIHKFGPGISCMNDLESLYLAHNQLSELDLDIYNLPKISQLLVQANIFQELPIDILKIRQKLILFGIGWGRFCEPKINTLLRDDELNQWFTNLKILFENQNSNSVYIIQYITYFSTTGRMQYPVQISSLEGINESMERISVESLREHQDPLFDTNLNKSSPSHMELQPLQSHGGQSIVSHGNFEFSNCLDQSQRQESILIDSFTKHFGVDINDSIMISEDKLEINQIVKAYQDNSQDYQINLSNKYILQGIDEVQLSIGENDNGSQVHQPEPQQFPLGIKQSLQKQYLPILDKLNQYQQNYMHIAVLHEEIGVLETLLDLQPELANQMDLKGHTPLSLSIEKEKYVIARILIQKGVDVTIGGQTIIKLSFITSGLRSSNLHLAAIHLQSSLAKDLILQNADPNLQDFFGDTPMHIAARNTNFEKVLEFMREIVQSNADLNKTNLKGQTVLEILCDRGNLQGVQYCHTHNLRCIELQIFHNIFLFYKNNSTNGNSLLHTTVQGSHVAILEYLLKQNLVSVQMENNNNQTPLQLLFRRMQRGGKSQYNKYLTMAKLIRSSSNAYFHQQGLYDTISVYSDGESSFKVTNTIGSCNFSSLQKNVINPMSYMKGESQEDDVIDLEQIDEQQCDNVIKPNGNVEDDNGFHSENFDLDSDESENEINANRSNALSLTLEKMKIIKPKFQPKHSQPQILNQSKRLNTSHFSLKLFNQGEDPYESPPPDDEFNSLQDQSQQYKQSKGSLRKKLQNQLKQSEGVKTINSSIKQSRLNFQFQSNQTISCNSSNNLLQINTELSRKGKFALPSQGNEINLPKHKNYSPNNISFIEGRNSFMVQNTSQGSLEKFNKTQVDISLYMKKLKFILFETVNSLSQLVIQMRRKDNDPLDITIKAQIEIYRYRHIKSFLKNTPFGLLSQNEKVIDVQLQLFLKKLDEEYLKFKEIFTVYQNKGSYIEGQQLSVEYNFKINNITTYNLLVHFEQLNAQ